MTPLPVNYRLRMHVANLVNRIRRNLPSDSRLRMQLKDLEFSLAFGASWGYAVKHAFREDRDSE